jgi:hypothetical protein
MRTEGIAQEVLAKVPWGHQINGGWQIEHLIRFQKKTLVR